MIEWAECLDLRVPLVLGLSSKVTLTLLLLEWLEFGHIEELEILISDMEEYLSFRIFLNPLSDEPFNIFQNC